MTAEAEAAALPDAALLSRRVSPRVWWSKRGTPDRIGAVRRVRTPVQAKDPETRFAIPPRRPKLTETQAFAAWDALPQTVSRPLSFEIHEEVLTLHGAYALARKAVRVIRSQDWLPSHHRSAPDCRPEADETWLTLWPAGWLRLGAPRPD